MFFFGCIKGPHFLSWRERVVYKGSPRRARGQCEALQLRARLMMRREIDSARGGGRGGGLYWFTRKRKPNCFAPYIRMVGLLWGHLPSSSRKLIWLHLCAWRTHNREYNWWNPAYIKRRFEVRIFVSADARFIVTLRMRESLNTISWNKI